MFNILSRRAPPKKNVSHSASTNINFKPGQGISNKGAICGRIKTKIYKFEKLIQGPPLINFSQIIQTFRKKSYFLKTFARHPTPDDEPFIRHFKDCQGCTNFRICMSPHRPAAPTHIPNWEDIRISSNGSET